MLLALVAAPAEARHHTYGKRYSKSCSDKELQRIKPIDAQSPFLVEFHIHTFKLEVLMQDVSLTEPFSHLLPLVMIHVLHQL